MSDIAVGCTLLPVLSKFLGYKFDRYGVSIFLEADCIVRVMEYGIPDEWESDQYYDLCYADGKPVLSKDLYEAIKLSADLPGENVTSVTIDIVTDEVATIRVTYALPARSLEAFKGFTLVSAR